MSTANVSSAVPASAPCLRARTQHGPSDPARLENWSCSMMSSTGILQHTVSHAPPKRRCGVRERLPHPVRSHAPIVWTRQFVCTLARAFHPSRRVPWRMPAIPWLTVCKSTPTAAQRDTYTAEFSPAIGDARVCEFCPWCRSASVALQRKPLAIPSLPCGSFYAPGHCWASYWPNAHRRPGPECVLTFDSTVWTPCIVPTLAPRSQAGCSGRKPYVPCGVRLRQDDRRHGLREIDPSYDDNYAQAFAVLAHLQTLGIRLSFLSWGIHAAGPGQDTHVCFFRSTGGDVAVRLLRRSRGWPALRVISPSFGSHLPQ